MQNERSYRGWIVTFTVAGVVTYLVLSVEHDFRLTHKNAQKGSTESRFPLSGIWLGSDPNIALAPQNKPTPIAPAQSADVRDRQVAMSDTAYLMSTPPEPVANVVLHAPTAIPDMVALNMSDAKANDKLINAIDHAFDAPVREVSLQRPVLVATDLGLNAERLSELTPKGVATGIMAEPTTLLRDLRNLRGPDASMHAVAYGATNADDLDSTRSIRDWTNEIESRVRRIVYDNGLQQPSTDDDLSELLSLTAQAHELTANMESHEQATRVGTVAYAVERRVRVWQAVASTLQNAGMNKAGFTADQVARERLLQLVVKIDSDMRTKPDGESWRKFLKLEELKTWSSNPDADWVQGNELATTVLTRLNWERLTKAQKTFLSGPEFDQLSSRLAPWAMQPVDFHQLLADLEQLEEDPINRCRTSLAHTVQSLRVSPEPAQRAVAEAVNDHYRNANIRLAVSGKLMQRMMPSESYEARPVRQRILGADTQGNSQVRTNLSVKLIPDPTAWHIQLGVEGDMNSATRSSKGPATFHQTSIAKIDTSRTMRMDPSGIKVNSAPTNVDTSQYLNGMSTNMDRLPLVGDFFRVIVREQFEQQRGLAQRITKRIIATETDQELDKQLKQKLSTAESQLQHTFIGPLERLGLSPIVVAMNTTDERLTIRYRLAGEGQMAAHTARPRAPGDALVSMQIHQSAINNAIGQLGLSEKTWTLSDLCNKLADAFDQSPWELPEEAPKDVTVRFAPSRPITVELQNGKLEMTLRIAELNHPERNMSFQRFVIRVSYVPVADGMRASLVRDGVVSVDGPRLGFGEKVPLRGIFGTVFGAHSSLNLIHRQWIDDPRAKDLSVSQVEVRDGWLSVAVSETGSPHAIETSEKAQSIETAQGEANELRR